MHHIPRGIIAGGSDSHGDISAFDDTGVVDVLMVKIANS